MNAMERKLDHIDQLRVLGSFAEALRHLNTLTTEVEDNGRAWELMGLVHFELANYQQSLDALERASLLVPLSVEAQCRLAECYMTSRRREVAAVIYAHLATLDVGLEELAELIGIGLKKIGQFDLALGFCLHHLGRFSSNHKLLFIVTESMRRLEYDNDVITPIACQVYRLQPDNVTYRVRFARHLLVARRNSEAVNLLQSVDLNALQCIPSLQRLRMLFEQLGEHDSSQICRARLQQIGYELSSAYRPPKEEH